MLCVRKALALRREVRREGLAKRDCVFVCLASSAIARFDWIDAVLPLLATLRSLLSGFGELDFGE
jgi:hypothetical protein